MYRDDEDGTNPTYSEPSGAANDEERDTNTTSQDASSTSNWIPPRLQKAWRQTVIWVKGPQPPRPWKIRPYFPKIQTAPIRFIDTYFPKRKHKIVLLVVFYICWLLSFGLVLHKSAFAADVPGYGSPVRLRCDDRFWRDGNGCGLNGDLCRPFENSTMPFRCPANCKRVKVVYPHAVGDQEITYRPLVIGGSKEGGLDHAYYRGDSFICGAAIHSGFINDQSGGCGVVSLVGEKSHYPSVKNKRIKSISFDSYFPQSFTFLKGTASKCRDLRWPLFAVSLTFTILISLFTTSAAVFFPSVFVGIFFHVALASDPPNLTDYYAIISIALGRFLPASFCMFAIYKFCVRRQHEGLTAVLERTVLWLGGCWIGAFNNYTFAKLIPLERLTPHDIQQQPGAIPALIIVALTLVCIAVGQAWALRIEGRLPTFLAVYGVFISGILALVAVPKMNVRIHHYILGLVLSPGTAMQNRPSLLFQGILIGLFINGIARWGFDSILQTPAELRGDAQLGTLLPVIGAPIVHLNDGIANLAANITFEFERPFPDGFDGLSVLVNDVERFRGYEDGGEDARAFTWVRRQERVKEYFRFAYLNGGARGDYTKAGVWGRDGGWTEAEGGPS